MQALSDEGHESSRSAAPAEAQGVQQGSNRMTWRKIKKKVGIWEVTAFECLNMKLTDDIVLMILQGLSSVAAVGPVEIEYEGEKFNCLPILAEGFHAYKVPVCFRRVVVGVPEEEPLPLELLIEAFA